MSDQNKDALKSQIDTYVDEVWPSVIEDIAALVSHKSVEDLENASEGAPWGPGPREALDEALCIANVLGLQAHDCEGYLGYADLPGSSDTQIATIAHVDVVPEGPGWNTDPYEMVQRDGWLLGRGVIDDKGPAVLSLYAAAFFAKQVEESGKKLPYTLRILLGANEETNMGDVEWYLNNYDEPAFLFTPDAEFPVCCGEKGIYHAQFKTAPIAGAAEGAKIVSFEGGTVINAVPSTAEALVRASASELTSAEGITVEPAEESQALIKAQGIGGHASLPEGTKNAINMLCQYLLANDICSPAERSFLEMEQTIHADTAGEALGIAATDDIFEPLTIIGGTIRTTPEGAFVQTVDSRYPKSTTGEAIMAKLSALAEAHGATFEVLSDVVPFYVDPSSPEIETLVRCYNEYMGTQAKAFTIGGGTYARHFKNAASFGPEEPTTVLPEWAGQMHGPNEAVSEELLKTSLKIYIYAIAELMELSL